MIVVEVTNEISASCCSLIWLLSRHGSFGFGFGIWRTYLGVGQKPIWTIAVGPLSIYVRKLYASERG